MIELYLEYITESSFEDRITVKVPLESYIVLVHCKYLREPEIGVGVQINFVQSKIESVKSSHAIVLNLRKLGIHFYERENWPNIANFCQLPTLICNSWVISGLCGICRRVTKNHIEHSKNPKRILGFKGNTLLAPAEISIWTKFCEVDIEKCVRDVLEFDGNSFRSLPEDLGKLESHLAQPLKVHNIYKLINNVHNVKVSSNQEFMKLENEAERFDFYANHKFVEGYEKTLADVMLYICVNIIAKRIPLERLAGKLPRLVSWYDRVTRDDDSELQSICDNLIAEGQSNLEMLNIDQLEVQVPVSYSLYKADTKKMNLLGEKVLTTNQPEVLGILDKVKCLGLNISSTPNDRDYNLFEWNDVPMDAKPEGGKLPNKRIERKKHQLECLASEVISLARPGDIIVDFCSGTGHLGILLAYLLPKCTIYLLENKEESQQLATERVNRLGLTNVVYLQCNLDYFTADFDIGVSLHACGVATDIVMEKCYNQNANFVCCPCCYGKLYEFERIQYPRSKIFQQSDLLLKEYLCIAHCADQTHDLDNKRTNIEKSRQGFYCMDIIDKDRALRADEFGYTVVQKRLIPENCTPKNRILVGCRKNFNSDNK